MHPREHHGGDGDGDGDDGRRDDDGRADGPAFDGPMRIRCGLDEEERDPRQSQMCKCHRDDKLTRRRSRTSASNLVGHACVDH